MEVRKILPLLVEASGEHPSFHVVALSLPGYGFSSAPIKRGFAVHHYAEVSAILGLGRTSFELPVTSDARLATSSCSPWATMSTVCGAIFFRLALS